MKDQCRDAPDLVEGQYRDLVRVGETLGGEVIGTPAYMPPEQALGDAVDERADVYALGALLYHLLSGTRPHHGVTVEDVLASVISGPPKPLAAKTPGVPADLVTIVEKAMAREPEHRYANAGELAVDLKRFQSGQLVGAHRYTGAQLVRRWLRKHRTAVIVAGLATVTLVTLGIVSFARIVREENEAQAARQLAEHNRALADDRRVAAEGLVTFMLGDLRNSLEPIGKLALLEMPAKKALDYFDARHELAPDERESRAVALERLGDALRGRGDVAGAETNFRAAIAERAKLTAEGHRQPEGQYLDANLRSDLADLLTIKGATVEAITEYRASIAMYAALTTSRPGDKRHGPRSEEQVLEKLGGVLVARHEYPAAQREYHAALELATARVKAAPDDMEAQRDMVAPEHAIGDALAAGGDLAGALATYRATRERLDGLTKRAPDDMPLLRMLMLSQHRIGVTLLAQKDVSGALVALHYAEAMSNRLVAQDPENHGWRLEQVLNLGRIAEAQRAGADPASTIATYRAGIAILRPLIATDDIAAKNLMVFQESLTELFSEAKQWPLAEAAGREAVEIAERRVKQDPALRISKLELADGYAALGNALIELKRPADALDIATRGETIARDLATSDPSDMMSQYNLAEAVINLGTARCAAKGHGDPHAAFDEAIAIASKHLAATPGDATWQGIASDARGDAKVCH